MLEARDISSGYGSMTVLKGVSLKVNEGELVGVIGANGAGKSTLLRSISGLLLIRAGMVVFEGKDITNLSPDRIVQMGIIHVPEGRHIFSLLTVLENLLLGCYMNYRRLGSDGRDRLLESVFDLFPVLKKRSSQKAGTMSGGEQQMLAIGRALMGEPRLLLTDEASLGLAPLMIQLICDTFKAINDQGVTVLLAEQNAHATLKLSHRIYVLEIGKVAAEGACGEFTLDKLKELYVA